MTPGPSEEAGKAAQGVIAALREQPTLLVLVIFNLLVIGGIGWAVREQRSYQHELMKMMLEHCVQSGFKNEVDRQVPVSPLLLGLGTPDGREQTGKPREPDAVPGGGR